MSTTRWLSSLLLGTLVGRSARIPTGIRGGHGQIFAASFRRSHQYQSGHGSQRKHNFHERVAERLPEVRLWNRFPTRSFQARTGSNPRRCFDIVAQAPPNTAQEQLQMMLQALLAERLKLALHHEEKELPFLALMVGKNGPKTEQPMRPPPLARAETRPCLAA